MDDIINLDHWFDKFDPFRDYARTCSYGGEKNSVELVRKDSNDPSKWRVYDWLAEGGANTAVIFPTYLMHQAHPNDGFGKTNADGRLVLTCFFDLEQPHGED